MAHELLRRRHETLGELLDKMEASLVRSQTFGTDMKSDVVEKDDCFEVTADIPGADKADVKVDYEADTLHIAATRHEIKDHSDKDGNILQSERSFGSVGRSYYLPNVDREGITAKYKNGVLHVVLPKTEVTKTSGIKIED
ncbi:Hsp20/alpha crystallin family protein [Weissella cibaria]|uniref:Hsp20/alpha crystallin family protein n=1 Tax=Weissella cibaria TaxID=137591 RepID=UPI002A7598F1|nr:Hsp20/alpha crystallin family protein [Weissella cibaria]MDY2520893.1 Hsp20/alpha crystallin family protein [Weissella cibaria]